MKAPVDLLSAHNEVHAQIRVLQARAAREAPHQAAKIRAEIETLEAERTNRLEAWREAEIAHQQRVLESAEADLVKAQPQFEAAYAVIRSNPMGHSPDVVKAHLAGDNYLGRLTTTILAG